MQLIKSAALVSVIILGAVAGCSSTTTIVQGDAGPTADAGKDVGVKPDSAPPSDGSAQSCTPQPTSGFVPTALTPAFVKKDACTTAMVDKVFTDCFDKTNSNQGKCTADGKATYVDGASTGDKCIACLETQESAAAWGALVAKNGYVSVNVNGCLATIGQADCAKANSDLSQCADVACPDGLCPVTDDASLKVLTTCNTNATKGAQCKTWADTANTACKTDGGADPRCDGTDFESLFKATAGTLCVTGG